MALAGMICWYNKIMAIIIGNQPIRWDSDQRSIGTQDANEIRLNLEEFYDLDEHCNLYCSILSVCRPSPPTKNLIIYVFL